MTAQWIPVWEDTPEYYVAVLVSYVYHDGTLPRPEHQRFWRGAGHLNEDGTWSIYGECDDMAPYSVVAWMEMPDPAYAVLEQCRMTDSQPGVSTEEAEAQRNERRNAQERET